MNILAIETCFGKCSICFFDGKIFHIKTEEAKNSHRNALPKMLEEIMQNCNLEIKNLDAIVVNHGPGTFTGIRIGIAFVHGLAISYDIPIYGISTMEGVVLKEFACNFGVAIRAIGDFCYYQKFFASGKADGEPLYIEVDNIPKADLILTNCQNILQNASLVDFPNAQNLIERFLFVKPKIFEKPLYIRQAV